jgi:5'(3')-deoxyribonucleotidase
MADDDNIALIDLDGTLADYDGAMKAQQALLASPNEPPFTDRYDEGGKEPPHIEARRKMIQRQPGFWRGLKKLPLGFEVLTHLRIAEFNLHILTKGPQNNGTAWGEKLEWSREHVSDAVVTVTGDKSLVYGRVLVDDYPEYFEAWLKVRPRGQVICLPCAWNRDYAKGGRKEHPRVLSYDGSNLGELKLVIERARSRKSREAL